MHIRIIISDRPMRPGVKVQIFRCYALDEKGSIVAAENIEADDLTAATGAGWQFVAAQNAAFRHSSHGLEIWQGV